MPDQPTNQLEPENEPGVDASPNVQSFQDLMDRVTGKNAEPSDSGGDAGLVEPIPFPFLAMVGQEEMKLALLLGMINPNIGGVLLLGPRGTGKTTIVRSLLDLLPSIDRSACFYGCLPEDIESGGMDSVCPECARKFALGLPLTVTDRVHLVELPLNSKIEDVIGGLDERALIHSRVRLKKGLLAQSDQNLLYSDEVNLLSGDIVDAILDAAAQGIYTVRRGAVSAAYRSRFVLIGSMNPEEGRLRPQIMDRFGLRVIVRGLLDPQERLAAYHRVLEYRANPRAFAARYQQATSAVMADVQTARSLLPQVTVPEAVAHAGLTLIRQLTIDSLRAEITLFEAARAHAAAENRSEVSLHDLQTIAPMALRLRRSTFMESYIARQEAEEQEILEKFESLR